MALEVNRALERLTTERLASMATAENLRRNELRGEVIAIPQNSEQALREGQLPAAAAAKLLEVHCIAEQMRARLEGQTTAHARVNRRMSARSAAPPH